MHPDNPRLSAPHLLQPEGHERGGLRLPPDSWHSRDTLRSVPGARSTSVRLAPSATVGGIPYAPSEEAAAGKDAQRRAGGALAGLAGVVQAFQGHSNGTTPRSLPDPLLPAH